MAHTNLSPDSVVQRWINEDGTNIVQNTLMFQWKTTPKYHAVFEAFEKAHGREPLTQPQFRTVMLHLSETPNATGVSHRMVGTAYQFMIKSRPVAATPAPVTLTAGAAAPTATYQFTVPYRTTITLASSPAAVPPAEPPAAVVEPVSAVEPVPVAEPTADVTAETVADETTEPVHLDTLLKIRTLNGQQSRLVEPAEIGLAVLRRFRGKYLKFTEQEFPNVIEFLDRYAVYAALNGRDPAFIEFVRSVREFALTRGGLTGRQVTALRDMHERHPMPGDPINQLALQFIELANEQAAA